MTLEELAQVFFPESEERASRCLSALKTAREMYAMIAEKKQSFSTMPNPSERDLGWKFAAKAITDEIRRS